MRFLDKSAGLPIAEAIFEIFWDYEVLTAGLPFLNLISVVATCFLAMAARAAWDIWSSLGLGLIITVGSFDLRGG